MMQISIRGINRPNGLPCLSALLRVVILSLFFTGLTGNLPAQGNDLINISDVLAVWEFDADELPGQLRDSVSGTGLELRGDAAISESGAGRSGTDGDRALDLGTGGSTENPTHAMVNELSPNGQDFIDKLNNSNSEDVLTVTFWQRWRQGEVGNSSSVWIASPSSGSGDRGFQAHLPWGNRIVYFDTSGCCGTPGNRLNGGVDNAVPPVDWEEWNHIALVKDGGAKQVWINGQLILDQADGAVPLRTDWTALFLGQSPTEPDIAFHGWLDEVALFSVALDAARIEALAGGASPMELTLPASEWPPVVDGVIPGDGTEFYSLDGGIGFRVTTAEPNTIPEQNISFFLNDADLSDQLVMDGGPREWQVRYEAPLQLNREYTARVETADSEGRTSSFTWNFNTLEGDPVPEFGAVPMSDIATARFVGGAVEVPAPRSIDGNFISFAESLDEPGVALVIELDRPRPLHRIELVNRGDNYADRMDGLLMELLDSDGQVIGSAGVTSPGRGGAWQHSPEEVALVSAVRLSIPGGMTNGAGDHVVSVAEVVLFTAPNYAQGAESYMMRFNESLPPTENGNDGDYRTHTESTPRAVGSFFEVDLGEERALYQVRVIAADGFQSRMTHTTVRVYDGNRDSVFSEHLGGSSPVFDVFLPGPVAARYVRVGFENKERSEPGTFWYLGLKELQAFGRPLEDVGIVSFVAESPQVSPGESTTLGWAQEDLKSLMLYPQGVDALSLTGSGGSGSIEVTPQAGVEYALVGGMFADTVIRYQTVLVDGEPLAPYINEVVSVNRLSLRDNHGESPDWIELRNPNPTPLSMAGYGVSDDPARPQRWVFPDGVEIPAHGFLILYASGRDEPYEGGGFIHLPFALSGSGDESLLLTAPDGVTVVDDFPVLPALTGDLAYGRTMTGDRAFLEPTPGEANLSPAYSGWLQPVSFSHSRGFYEEPFQLEISHPDEEAEILVSTDGGRNWQPWTGAMTVENPVSVRAQVHRDGFKSPPVQTHTYFFHEATLSASNMNQSLLSNTELRNRARLGLEELPTVNISIPALPDDWNEWPASVELFLPGMEPIQLNAGVERFGGAWTEFAKKNYRLKFRSEYGARKLEAPLFTGFDRGVLAVDRFDEIDLRAGGHDMSSRGFYMSARFSEDTMLDMGSLNPHGRFVNLYFNGEYWGQYHARERLTDAFLADYLGGQREDYTNVRGNDNDGSNFVPGTPDPLNREPWLGVLERRGDFESVSQWLDVSHLIDFMLMWNYGNAETEYRAAGPIQPGSGFKFWLGDADGHIRPSSDRTGNPGPGGIFGALVSEGHPDFMMLLADRAHRHLTQDGALTPARSIQRLRDRMEEIHNSLVAECARWGYRTPQNWESAAQDAISNFFPGQSATLLSRLRSRGLYPSLDAPQLSQYGGVVEGQSVIDVQVTGGDVYYTLSGADPRLPGGGVNPEAVLLGGAGGATLTGQGRAWDYLDVGSAPAGDWVAIDYIPANWSRGTAPLGYGDAGIATTVNFGPDSGNKFPTTYFRREFTVADAAAHDQVFINFVRDDGVAIYLNGVEIIRDNLPSGELQYQTLALSAAGGGDETLVRTRTVPAGLLRTGKNVLSAEVHQASGSSSDLRFDAWLESATSLEIPVDPGSHLMARAWDGRNWSALTESRYFANEATTPGPGDLVVSELSYNPDGDDEFEFIELLNTSGRYLSLDGLRLSGGVEFLFPDGLRMAPNELIVIVENAEAFASRYSDDASEFFYPDIAVAGQWSGRLSDEGESFTLEDSQGNLLVHVSWEDGEPWPLLADGDGSSLELRDPATVAASAGGAALFLDQPEQWKNSRLYHGSPGRIDTITVPADLRIGIALTENPGEIRISFSSNEPGLSFALESSPSISSPEWTLLQNLETTDPGEQFLTFVPPQNSGQVFYRLRLLGL